MANVIKIWKRHLYQQRHLGQVAKRTAANWTRQMGSGKRHSTIYKLSELQRAHKLGVGEFACRTFACLVFLWSFACWVNYSAQITCRHLLVGTNTCRTFTCRERLVQPWSQTQVTWQSLCEKEQDWRESECALQYPSLPSKLKTYSQQ